MALEPETTGTGRLPGHRSASDVPSAASVAIGAEPPPEKDTVSPGTAAGLSDPSEFRRSVVLTGVQPVPRRTRTGSTYSASDSRPPGSAVTVVVAVVSPAMTTGLPESCACRSAAAVAATVAAAGCAADCSDALPPISAMCAGCGGVCGSGYPLDAEPALAWLCPAAAEACDGSAATPHIAIMTLNSTSKRTLALQVIPAPWTITGRKRDN